MDMQKNRQTDMLLHIYGGDPYLLFLRSHMQGGLSFTSLIMYNFINLNGDGIVWFKKNNNNNK